VENVVRRDESAKGFVMTAMADQQALESAATHYGAGRWTEAEAICRQMLARRPESAEALQMLGLALAGQGRVDEAIDALGRAAALRPGDVGLLSNLGNALMMIGRVAEAIDWFRRALALDRGNAVTAYNLGRALCAIGEWEEAVVACREAAALMPGSADARVNLAVALRECGRFDESLMACREALAIMPSSAAALNNLGSALAEKGSFEEAIAAWERALAISPGSAEARCNIGNARLAMGEVEQAVAEFRRVLAMQPDFAPAHWNLSLALLLQGNYGNGFAEYEWRWRMPAIHEGPRQFDRPPWDGAPLHGQHILLYSEQGLGDAIQFVRFVPMVAERGGRVVIECEASLRRLFAGMVGVERAIEAGQALGAFDLHCPLMSLGRVLATTVETIPASVPYLSANAGAIEHWRGRVAGLGDGMKVGLAWAGSRAHRQDRKRSIALEALAPLAEAGDIRLVSLQKGLGDAAGMVESSMLDIVDWTDELGDFTDTAGLIASLDLVISVDTAVAHLAGAMGKPVWVLIPFSPDWRWMMGREDSPWYPTMRLFRQDVAGDWSGPIARIVAQLRGM
jgi:tetratricopeptide (TPR) repeat protein